MKQYRQFQPLVISQFETNRWQHPVHQHNHYEFICVQNGSGSHVIKGKRVDYSSGDIFLIGPDDDHYFEIANVTRFVFIKFTDPYSYSAIASSPQLRSLEYLLKSRETHLSAFKLPEHDSITAQYIVETVISLKHDLLRNERLIWLQILALAEILQRNMPDLNVEGNLDKDIQALYCYIHKHIYSPDKLRAPVMAMQFNTTPYYIGPYFKRKTGISIRDYIKNYRGALIEKRLESGGFSLKQIAAEFGLTDESHVVKLRSR